MPETKRPIRVFLCHASQDKPAVRELYQRLKKENWIDPWLDEEKLTLGQHWTSAIEDALDAADVVVIFLSHNSVQKEGFVQRELNYAWDISLEKPRSVIFLIPFRLDECEVPRHLRSRQWGDYFGEKKEGTYKTLLRSLKERHQQKLHLEAEDNTDQNKELEIELKVLESQAIRYELMGDFWNARKTWYAIKQINPLFPRVDIKIGELEREVAEKMALEKAERQAAEKVLREKMERQASARDALKRFLSKTILSFRMMGIIGILAILFWAGLWAISKINSPIPTAIDTATQRPMAQKTSTKTPIIASKTPKQNPTSTPTKTRTPLPMSLPTEITDTRGVEMLLVQEGNFTMGSNDGPEYAKPAHIVYLDSFYIDKYEVTNVHYKACVDAGICRIPKDVGSQSQPFYYGNDLYNNYPVINTDWNMAKTYCEWRGTRLPTEAEWEKATRGIDGRTYPWGENFDCSYANIKVGNFCIGGPTKVGSYENGKSPYGLYDMTGNVQEWVSDWFSKDYYVISPSSNPLGPSSGGTRVVRGGSWNLRVGSFYRNFFMPDVFSGDIGFRCSKNANP